MREYALVALVSAVVTWLVTGPVRVLARRWGALAAVRDRDVHTIPTPRLGGIGMYAGLAAGLLVAARLPVLKDTFTRSSEPRAVLIGGALICALGVLDDRYDLDALTKFAGQITAAGVLVLLGVQLSYLSLPGKTYVLASSQAVPLTVLVAVVLINAVNFVDGLDGLAAGVVAIAAAATFAYSYHLLSSFGESLYTAPASLMTAALFGACVGFLPHNFHPARIFMGDSGSMLIGLVLAASMTSVTGQVDFGALPRLNKLPLLVPLLVPLAVLAVPFVDLVLAVARRTRARRSPFSPDKLHLHHRLLEIGHSQTRAVLLMYAWAAVLGFGGVVLSFSHGGVLDLAALGGLVLAVAVASTIPRLRRGGRRADRRAAGTADAPAAAATGPTPPGLAAVTSLSGRRAGDGVAGPGGPGAAAGGAAPDGTAPDSSVPGPGVPGATPTGGGGHDPALRSAAVGGGAAPVEAAAAPPRAAAVTPLLHRARRR